MLSDQATPGEAVMTKTETDSNGVETVHPVESEQVQLDLKPAVLPCVVGIEAGQTIPVGNYANVRVGVFLSVTCEPTEIDEAYNAVSEWVGDKLGEMVTAVNEAYGG